MNDTSKTVLGRAVLGTVAALATIPAALAHEGDAVKAAPHAAPPASAVLELEAVRQATARYLDVDQAVADGYVDIGLFYSNMGWHYLKEGLLDDRFDATAPELLVYADDPCGGKRRLVAVEYAIPLALSKRAPVGFTGPADVWTVNTTFGLWTLHAWVFEYNPDGVFAGNNPRVQ